MKESEMFRANKILEANKKRIEKVGEIKTNTTKLEKIIQQLEELNDNERAILVEILHDKYRLTYKEEEASK